MVVADIFNQINLGSVTTNANGSGLDTSRLTRKSVFVQLLAGSNATVNIEASHNNIDWSSLDSKTYSSGTAVQKDIFSYVSHFPYMRTTTTNLSGTTVSTVITGRGV